MSTLPPGPVDDLLLCSFEDAEAAVKRWVERHHDRLPWVRSLGPWFAHTKDGQCWDRNFRNERGAHIWGARVFHGPGGWMAINMSRYGHQGPYATRSEAMAVADAGALAENWLFDPAIPAEDVEPVWKGPTPLPAPEPLPPVPHVNHRWQLAVLQTTHDRLDRCRQCNRWRLKDSTRARYLGAHISDPEIARSQIIVGQGEILAGACPGGRR